MSKKVMRLVGSLFAAGILVAIAAQGCGGGDAVDCNKACAQAVKCAGGFVTMDQCTAQCAKGPVDPAGKPCKNSSAIVSKINSCSAMTDCTAYGPCIGMLPDCESSSGGAGAGGAGTTGQAGSRGAGGTTGSAGSSGSGAGGSAGTTCATACAKADACCMAMGGTAAQCVLKSMCDMAGANSSFYVSACNQFLSQSGGGNAACQ